MIKLQTDTETDRNIRIRLCKSTGFLVNQEMLDFHYQNSKELEHYRMEYEDAAYRVYNNK